MAEDNKCAHVGCVCQKMQDSDYCSAFCENSEDSGVQTIKCECGHPGCS